MYSVTSVNQVRISVCTDTADLRLPLDNLTPILMRLEWLFRAVFDRLRLYL